MGLVECGVGARQSTMEDFGLVQFSSLKVVLYASVAMAWRQLPTCSYATVKATD
jgi:hypothetical protein